MKVEAGSGQRAEGVVIPSVSEGSGRTGGALRTNFNPRAALPPKSVAHARDDKRAVVFLMTLMLSGCSFFSRSQPKIYTLDVVPAAAPVANVGGTRVAIESIELPPGFDRSEIVVRKAGQQLEVRSAELWSSTLQPLVLHTLAFDLASRLPQGMVVLPGEAKPAGAMRSIDVVFADFSAGPQARINVDAQVVIRTPGAADVTRHEQFAVDLQSLDDANIATGMSRAIATLADRVAGGL